MIYPIASFVTLRRNKKFSLEIQQLTSVNSFREILINSKIENTMVCNKELALLMARNYPNYLLEYSGTPEDLLKIQKFIISINS